MEPSRPSGPSTPSARGLALLAALAVALGAAFVVAPRTLASIGSSGFADRSDLAASFREAFIAYWSADVRELSPDLERIVDYWVRYHLAKAALAALLLIVLVALAARLWKAFLKAGGPGPGQRAALTSTALTSTALASAGTLVTALALFASAVVPANLQGATAPFASLLPMLTSGSPDGRLAETLDHIRQRLADSPNTGASTPPALSAMIGDFAVYHVAMAVLAAIAAVALLALSVTVWKRFARTASSDRRTRRLQGAFGVLSVLSALVALVVAAANTATASDPAPALLAFFEGGW